MIRSMEAEISNARAAAVLAAAVVAGLAVAALQLASDHRDPVALWVVFAPGVCWSFVATGIHVWQHRPESRIGALMALGAAQRAADRRRPDLAAALMALGALSYAVHAARAQIPVRRFAR